MHKVMFNGTLRATFAKREDTDNFVDTLCGDAEKGTTIAVIGPDDKFLYGFDKDGNYQG